MMVLILKKKKKKRDKGKEKWGKKGLRRDDILSVVIWLFLSDTVLGVSFLH